MPIGYNTVRHRFRQFLAVARYRGLGEAIERTKSVLRRNAIKQVKISRDLSNMDSRLRLLVKYPSQKLAQRAAGDGPMSIHWVIPDFGPGGGGHMNIFRAIYWLEYYGHINTVWITSPSINYSIDSARELCLKRYLPIKARFNFINDEFNGASGDVIVATDSWSVWPVLSATQFSSRAYFVQDYESLFTASGALSAVTDYTYDQDLHFICGGPWLEQMLRLRGKTPSVFCFGVDHNIFNNRNVSRSHSSNGSDSFPPVRIAFYARAHTPRRAVELAWMAFEMLAARGVNFVVDAFGQDEPAPESRFPVVSHGVLSPDELSLLYQQSDVGVCFSTTNYSIMGQEMAATGLPVVELDGPNTRSSYAKDAVIFAKPHPEKIAEVLEALARAPQRRAEIGAKAIGAVSGLDWKTPMSLVETSLRLSTGSRGAFRHDVGTVSVVIPTLNGGEIFREVIRALANQDFPGEIEIVTIDSGSTDGTYEAASQLTNGQVIQIDKNLFNHGATRNAAISRTRGDFIALLTQDAVPDSPSWLFTLWQSLQIFPKAAGVFGPHKPHDGATKFVRNDLRQHFDRIQQYPLYLDAETPFAPELGPREQWEQNLHFFSTNNCMIRRSAWEYFKFPEVNYGEDQTWAKTIIKAGFGKVYNPQAVVRHSHDYDPDELRKFGRVESAFFKIHFGYSIVSKESASAAVAVMNANDTLFAIKNGVPEPQLRRRLLQNEARIAGRLEGLADTEVQYLK